MKKALAGLALAAAVLMIAGSIIARPRWTSDPNPVQIRIPKGSGQNQVVQMLAENGVVRSPAAFKFLSKLPFGGRPFRHGTYLFEKNRYFKILTQLRQGQTLRLKVTFPEGWSAWQIGERLAAAGIIADAEAFHQWVRTGGLDGMLYPETYYFEPGSEPDAVAGEMVRQFRRVYGPDLQKRAAELNWNDRQVLAMASIIEREARIDSERAAISSVYHNRLKIRKPLEADPTVQFGISEGKYWKDRLTYKDLHHPSPYNTYRRAGLPPGPICNPGIESIRAALYPAETPYLYFVADPDGTGVHHFTQTYDQHLQIQRDLRRQYRLKQAAASGAKSQ